MMSSICSGVKDLQWKYAIDIEQLRFKLSSNLTFGLGWAPVYIESCSSNGISLTNAIEADADDT